MSQKACNEPWPSRTAAVAMLTKHAIIAYSARLPHFGGAHHDDFASYRGLAAYRLRLR